MRNKNGIFMRKRKNKMFNLMWPAISKWHYRNISVLQRNTILYVCIRSKATKRGKAGVEKEDNIVFIYLNNNKSNNEITVFCI